VDTRTHSLVLQLLQSAPALLALFGSGVALLRTHTNTDAAHFSEPNTTFVNRLHVCTQTHSLVLQLLQSAPALLALFGSGVALLCTHIY
jgi:hypothetical protein